MFYRRKLILSLIQLFGGELEKTRLQKLLFLTCQNEDNPEYDFVPYKYGCYSFSAAADLNTMARKGILQDNNGRFKLNGKKENYSKSLNQNDLQILFEIKNKYENLSLDGLIKYTYVNFPYWAIKSVIAKDILSKAQLKSVAESRHTGEKTVLFTIGYEGISLEEYFNRLIRNDVKVLVDVRRNPVSMKFGFSKNQLKSYCDSLDIKYVHFPELGIESSKRKDLNSFTDYENLFSEYKRNLLPHKKNELAKIAELLEQNKRIALTCFEADKNCCHRSHTANALNTFLKKKTPVEHI
jgi:uncharacterized protein YwgA